MIQLVFLARMRERFGVSRESFPLAADRSDYCVNDLLQALRERGGVFAEELAPDRSFRVAVNQEVVSLDRPLGEGDEVAIFPPVTGG